MVNARGWSSALPAFTAALLLAGSATAGATAPPNTPTDLSTEFRPCQPGEDRSYVSTRTPKLRAELSADGGVLSADFVVRQGETQVAALTATDVPSGSFAEVTLPQGVLAENGVYSWSVRASDGTQSSDWAGDCEFQVDSVKPNQPVVTSADYPSVGFHGAPGRTGIFTFSPNGSTDVVRYAWWLDGEFGQIEATGSVDVPLTPKQDGTTALSVRAFDKAGNPSPEQSYVFMVADAPRPSTPVAVWNLDETAGTTAADTTGNGHPLTLNGAAFGTGYSKNGQVNSTGSFSSTSSALVDTSRAFAVSAWVKLADVNADYTIASQDGDSDSGFSLRYSGNRWSFGAASSSTPARAGEWTHLVASYEPHQVSLYVDGKLEATADTTFAGASGPFVLGAGQRDGERVEQAAATIDHVQVWSRAVTAEEAATHNNLVVLRARYSLDELSGTTTRDEVNGQIGTLSGSASWGTTPVDPDDPNQTWGSADKWVRFAEAGTGQVTAPHPVDLRTDRSFTVSAWVRTSDDGTAVTVLGTSDSAFVLGREAGSARWSFRLADGTVVHSYPSATGRWVHLVATYDAVTRTGGIYVGTARQSSEQAGPQAAGTTGDLQIGRRLKGDVDDVRAWSGVMTEDDVRHVWASSMHR